MSYSILYYKTGLVPYDFAQMWTGTVLLAF